MEAAWREVAASAAQVLRIFADHEPAPGREETTPLDVNELAPMLDRLRQLLGENRFEADALTETLHARLKDTPYREAADKVLEYVSRFDFQSGLEAFDELRKELLL